MEPLKKSGARVLTGLPGRDQLGGGLVAPTQRGRMLDAITSIVAEKGYLATTVADVIERAGVSRKTFYEQFKDKEDCYVTAWQFATDHVIARLVRDDDPRQELARRWGRLLGGYLRALAQSPIAARAFTVEVRAAGAAAQTHRNRILDQFADLFSRGDDIEPDPVLAPVLRAGLIAAVDEIVDREIMEGRTAQLPALEPLLTELAIRVLSPRRARNGAAGAAAKNT